MVKLVYVHTVQCDTPLKCSAVYSTELCKLLHPVHCHVLQLLLWGCAITWIKSRNVCHCLNFIFFL